MPARTIGKAELLSPGQRDTLIDTLRTRFGRHMTRHPGLAWEAVHARLAASPAGLWSLNEMERTGGEPDVVRHDEKTGACVFFDCSAESPSGRRSVCYDGDALAARKEHKPRTSALEMAAAMGIEILTEDEYRADRKSVV